MAPYFQTIKNFADIPCNDKGIPTVEFLEASDGLVSMFDLLGVGVFSFVQADIKSNIHGVRTTYTSNPEECRTLEKLVHSEVDDAHKHGTGCLRRLLRGLLFTLRALQNVRSSPQTEDRLQPSFQKAYDTVLKRHHNFAIRTVVQVALRACPKRKEFYDRIAQGGAQDKLDSELARWLGGLEMILLRMMDFYAMGGHGDI